MNGNYNMKNEQEKAYFAAVNTKDGFVSFFEDIFFGKGITRRYIIKGGPGTGKSSFMRKIALWARQNGKNVEYYYCSSDPHSLDGIVIDGRIAFLDGTAPHSYDTVLPGACDELIDLGRFWDSKALGSQAQTIGALTLKKREAYGRAYGYLSAAGRVRTVLESMTSSCIKWDKMLCLIHRSCEHIKGAERKGRVEVRQVSAFSTCGRVRFDTLLRCAEKTYAVEDHYGAAALFMRKLYERAIELGRNIQVSFDTLDVTVPNEIYFSDSGDYFVSCDGADEYPDAECRIRMKRFVDVDRLSGVRSSYRMANNVLRTLTDLALHQLSCAGDAHAEIEKIYVANMDFHSLQKYCSEFLKSNLQE